MWARAFTGVGLFLLGALWIAQGLGAAHGSPMTGHRQYAVLGVFVSVIGLALLVWAYRIRRRNTRRGD